MILDWQFFLTKEGGTVDWKRISDVLERTRLKALVDLFTVFCEKYCGLKSGIYVVDERPDEKLLKDFVDDVFSEKIKKDLCWYKMQTRILNRFRKLIIMPFFTAVWRIVAYNSYLDRRPTLD